MKHTDNIPAHMKLINELLILNLIETMDSFVREFGEIINFPNVSREFTYLTLKPRMPACKSNQEGHLGSGFCGS